MSVFCFISSSIRIWNILVPAVVNFFYGNYEHTNMFAYILHFFCPHALELVYIFFKLFLMNVIYF